MFVFQTFTTFKKKLSYIPNAQKKPATKTVFNKSMLSEGINELTRKFHAAIFLVSFPFPPSSSSVVIVRFLYPSFFFFNKQFESEFSKSRDQLIAHIF